MDDRRKVVDYFPLHSAGKSSISIGGPGLALAIHTYAGIMRKFFILDFTERFMRILHYGILSCAGSRKLYVLPLLHQQLESRYEYPEEKHWKQISVERLGFNPDACPVCKQLTMVTVFNFDRRGPPDTVMMKDIVAKHLQCQASS